jgi:hypothetical protein
MNGTCDEVLCCVAFDIYTALIPMAGIGSIDVTHPLSSLASFTQLFSVQAEREHPSTESNGENDRGDVACYVIRRLPEVNPLSEADLIQIEVARS